jgi:hypothetical protein
MPQVFGVSPPTSHEDVRPWRDSNVHASLKKIAATVRAKQYCSWSMAEVVNRAEVGLLPFRVAPPHSPNRICHRLDLFLPNIFVWNNKSLGELNLTCVDCGSDRCRYFQPYWIEVFTLEPTQLMLLTAQYTCLDCKARFCLHRPECLLQLPSHLLQHCPIWYSMSDFFQGRYNLVKAAFRRHDTLSRALPQERSRRESLATLQSLMQDLFRLRMKQPIFWAQFKALHHRSKGEVAVFDIGPQASAEEFPSFRNALLNMIRKDLALAVSRRIAVATSHDISGDHAVLTGESLVDGDQLSPISPSRLPCNLVSSQAGRFVTANSTNDALDLHRDPYAPLSTCTHEDTGIGEVASVHCDDSSEGLVGSEAAQGGAAQNDVDDHGGVENNDNGNCSDDDDEMDNDFSEDERETIRPHTGAAEDNGLILNSDSEVSDTEVPAVNTPPVNKYVPPKLDRTRTGVAFGQLPSGSRQHRRSRDGRNKRYCRIKVGTCFMRSALASRESPERVAAYSQELITGYFSNFEAQWLRYALAVKLPQQLVGGVLSFEDCCRRLISAQARPNCAEPGCWPLMLVVLQTVRRKLSLLLLEREELARRMMQLEGPGPTGVTSADATFKTAKILRISVSDPVYKAVYTVFGGNLRVLGASMAWFALGEWVTSPDL